MTCYSTGNISQDVLLRIVDLSGKLIPNNIESGNINALGFPTECLAKEGWKFFSVLGLRFEEYDINFEACLPILCNSDNNNNGNNSGGGMGLLFSTLLPFYGTNGTNGTIGTNGTNSTNSTNGFFNETELGLVEFKKIGVHDWPRDSKIVLYFLVTICLLQCLIGLVDYFVCGRKRTQRKHQGCLDLILCFSAYTNYRKLWKINDNKGRVKILDGIRVISILWVILGHVTLMLMTTTPLNNPVYFMEFLQTFSLTFITNYTFAADTFLWMAGFLSTYTLLRSGLMKKLDTKKYLLVVFHRYLRLTPLYIVVIMIYWKLTNVLNPVPVTRTGSFHLMDTEHGENCPKFWLNLFYLSNYFFGGRQCLPHGWYLNVDMQLFVWVPMFLYLMGKEKVLTRLSVMAIILFSSMAGCLWALIHNYHFFDVTNLVDGDYFYTQFYFRLGPYGVGAIMGYYQHKAFTIMNASEGVENNDTDTKNTIYEMNHICNVVDDFSCISHMENSFNSSSDVDSLSVSFSTSTSTTTSTGTDIGTNTGLMFTEGVGNDERDTTQRLQIPQRPQIPQIPQRPQRSQRQPLTPTPTPTPAPTPASTPASTPTSTPQRPPAYFQMSNNEVIATTQTKNHIYNFMVKTVIFTVLYLVLSGIIIVGHYNVPNWFNFIYSGFARLFFSLCLTGIFIMCQLYEHHVVNQFLCSDYWCVPSRLTYSVYLIHINVILYVLRDDGPPKYMSKAFYLYYYIIAVIISFVVGLFISVFFERPFIAASKIMINRILYSW